MFNIYLKRPHAKSQPRKRQLSTRLVKNFSDCFWKHPKLYRELKILFLIAFFSRQSQISNLKMNGVIHSAKVKGTQERQSQISNLKMNGVIHSAKVKGTQEWNYWIRVTYKEVSVKLHRKRWEWASLVMIITRRNAAINQLLTALRMKKLSHTFLQCHRLFTLGGI